MLSTKPLASGTEAGSVWGSDTELSGVCLSKSSNQVHGAALGYKTRRGEKQMRENHLSLQAVHVVNPQETNNIDLEWPQIVGLLWTGTQELAKRRQRDAPAARARTGGQGRSSRALGNQVRRSPGLPLRAEKLGPHFTHTTSHKRFSSRCRRYAQVGILPAMHAACGTPA